MPVTSGQPEVEVAHETERQSSAWQHGFEARSSGFASHATRFTMRVKAEPAALGRWTQWTAKMSCSTLSL